MTGIYRPERTPAATGPEGRAPRRSLRSTRFATSRRTSRNIPTGPDRFAARFHLGEAQLAGRRERRRPDDLGRPGQGPRPRSPIRRSAPRNSATSGPLRSTRSPGPTASPGPPDDTQLNLGVAALRRFLAVAPSTPEGRPVASFEVGEAYLEPEPGGGGHRGFPRPSSRGMRYQAETRRGEARPRRPLDDGHLRLSPARSRGRGSSTTPSPLSRAISPGSRTAPSRPTPSGRSSIPSFRSPSRPRWPSRKFAEARAAWRAFVDQNPLDARVPQVLVRGRPELRGPGEEVRRGHRRLGPP